MSFKESYILAKTFGDLDRVIDDLSDNAIHEMIGAMTTVSDTTGLDMKQVATLRALQSLIKSRTSKAQLDCRDYAACEGCPGNLNDARCDAAIKTGYGDDINKCDNCKIKDGADICIIGGC